MLDRLKIKWETRREKDPMYRLKKRMDLATALVARSVELHDEFHKLYLPEFADEITPEQIYRLTRIQQELLGINNGFYEPFVSSPEKFHGLLGVLPSTEEFVNCPIPEGKFVRPQEIDMASKKLENTWRDFMSVYNGNKKIVNSITKIIINNQLAVRGIIGEN